MNLAAYSKRDLHILGKLLAARQPEVAEQMLSSHKNLSPALDTELTNIPLYFLQFCSFNDLQASAIAVKSRERLAVLNKKKFIGCMLAIYAPWCLTRPIKDLNLIHGFVRKVAYTLNQSENNVSEKIREVITHYKAYDDFRGEIDTTVTKMKGGLS